MSKDATSFGNLFETDGTKEGILKMLGSLYNLIQKEDETFEQFHERVHTHRLTHMSSK